MLRIFAISICFLFSGCSIVGPYKETFSQGKVVTEEMMDEIFIGMTEFAAEEFLGDPV